MSEATLSMSSAVAWLQIHEERTTVVYLTPDTNSKETLPPSKLF